MQRTPKQEDELRETCPLQDVIGETPNISEYLEFGFYDHLSYKENYGLEMTDIVRWLRVSQKVGKLMSYWIMNQKGMVISRMTVQRITIPENDTEKIKESVNQFETFISCFFKEEEDLTYDGSKLNPEEWSKYLKYELEF